MRRLLFSLLAMSLMSVFVGCGTFHGVCDCDTDFEDNCGYRAPWIRQGTKEPHMPEIKEALPNPPKKL